jgi:hypothetical protein
MTPLHFAAWYGNPTCVQALINANANINAFDHDGATAAHAASHNGMLNTLMVLVETGKCDLLITDNENQTPKDSAIKQQTVECVDYLKVMEEDQRRTNDLERLTKLFNDATAHSKEYKPEVTAAVKAGKKVVAQQEKEAKRERKETMKLKKKGKDRPSVATEGGDGPTSFSKMAMPSGRTGSPATVDGQQPTPFVLSPSLLFLLFLCTYPFGWFASRWVRRQDCCRNIVLRMNVPPPSHFHHHHLLLLLLLLLLISPHILCLCRCTDIYFQS